MNVHVVLKNGKEVVFMAAEYVARGPHYIIQRHFGTCVEIGRFEIEQVAGIYYENA